MNKRSVPLRKVTGQLNPEWRRISLPDPEKGALTLAQVVDEMERLPNLVRQRAEVGQALIDEEERIIDEFCGLKKPSEWVKPPPQYPLDVDKFTQDYHSAEARYRYASLHPLARMFCSEPEWWF